jgi:hypothetical protein
MSKDVSEAFLGVNQESVKEQISKEGRDGFVASLRQRVLAQRLSIKGRSIVDDQGAMLLADEAEQNQTSSAEAANQGMQRWEVVL